MFSRGTPAQAYIGMSSNGRTADSGSVNGGSTPSIPANVLLYSVARSSSGLGRRPLKAEITGSNPVRATNFGLKAEITGSNPVRATNFGPFV